MNPRLPRLALSVVGKPSFIRKRLEALRKFGSNPFHPRRAMFAGLAVTLGIVAVMTVMFGQQPKVEAQSAYSNLQKIKAQTWIPTAEELHRHIETQDHTQHDLVLTLIEPSFYLNNFKEQSLKIRWGFSGIMAFHIQKKGLFMFSHKPFEGASQSGFAQNNVIHFQLPEYNGSIVSKAAVFVKPQFRDKKVPIYVKWDKAYNGEKLRTSGKMPAYKMAVVSTLDDGMYFKLISTPSATDFYRERGVKPAISFSNPQMLINGDSLNCVNDYWLSDLRNDQAVFQDDDLYAVEWIGIGTFFFSTESFRNAAQIVQVKNGTLSVNTPKGKVEIKSDEPILNKKEGMLWYNFIPEKNPVYFNKKSQVAFIIRKPRI